DVCAVGYGTVIAFAATLPGPPHVINLDPSSVPDVLQDIETVGAALAVPERALDARAGRDRGRHGAARPHGRGRGARPVGGGRRRCARGARARLLRLRSGAHHGRPTAPRDAPRLGGAP